MRTKFIAATALGATLIAGTAGLVGVVATGAAGATTPTSTQKAAPTASAHHSTLRRLRRHEIVVAADAVGVTPAVMRADLKAGQSIADVALTKGVSTGTVVTAIEKDATTYIDAAVTAGKVTQAQATALEAKLPTFANRLVNAHRGHRNPVQPSS